MKNVEIVKSILSGEQLEYYSLGIGWILFNYKYSTPDVVLERYLRDFIGVEFRKHLSTSRL